MSDDQRGYDDARRGNQQTGQGADYDRGRSQAQRDMAIEANRRAWSASDSPPRAQGQSQGTGTGPQARWLPGFVLVIGLLCGFVLVVAMARRWMISDEFRLGVMLLFFACAAGVSLHGLPDGASRGRAWGRLLLMTMATIIGLNLFFSIGHTTYPVTIYRAAASVIPAAGLGILAALIAVAILIGARTVRGAFGWSRALLASAAVFAALTVAQLLIMR
jgi:hypothetical protein